MGRKRAIIDTFNQADEVLRRLKTESGWKRERLLTIKHALDGMGYRDIGALLGRSPASIQSWIKKFRNGGVEDLLTKGKGNGPKSRLTPEMAEALKKKLAEGKWRKASQAWDWLSTTYDMGDTKPATIYRYLGKCGGRLKVPRPSNPKKDPEAEEKFRKELADRLLEMNLPTNRPVRLWVYDEMRFGLQPLTRRMWAPFGVRITAPSRRRYENGYLYGALQVGGAGSEFLFTPNLNKQWDLTFLRQISERYPDAIHVVIGDGAGFHHKDGAEEIPDNIRLITLPAYCPELNPVEKLWDIIKDGICNIDWPDFAALEQAVEDNLKSFWADAKNVFRLIGSSYLPSELNAISN